MHFDLIVSGGTVFDGSGASGIAADVGIRGDRIAAVGDISGASATRAIDATGLAVCPGFVDPHTHACWQGNMSVAAMHADNMLRQGVTSIILGNCGRSGWPVRDVLERMAECGIRTNMGTLVGHHRVRRQVMGEAAERACATPAQLDAMQRLVREALDDGAFGVSVGYAKPYERTDEIAHILAPVAEADAIYPSHIRSESYGLIRGVGEVIELSQRVGVRAHIAHLKAAEVPNWPKLDIVLAMLEDAADRGFRVTADRYPYVVPASGTWKLMPDWCYAEATQRGGKQRLKDPDIIDRFRQALVDYVETRYGRPEWFPVISLADGEPETDGKTLAQLMAAWNTDLVDTVLELERRGDAGGGIGALIYAMNEDNLRRVLQHPLVMIASDAGPTGRGESRAQPRAYSSYARVLGKYVREEGVLRFEDAVRKMTSMPAERFGIVDRGYLRVGMFADITIVDRATVAETATLADPHQYPAGMPSVIVNGRIAVEKSVTAESCSGVPLLRRPSSARA